MTIARHAGVKHLSDRAVLPENYHAANREVLQWGGRVRCTYCRELSRHFYSTCPFAEAALAFKRKLRETGDIYSNSLDGAAGVERFLHSV